MQEHGDLAEKAVSRYCSCPNCKKPSAKLKVLPEGFTCADVICDFCGYLAQVKGTSKRGRITSVPGGGWVAQEQRLDAGIYFPLYIVKLQDGKPVSIHYLPADFLKREFFVKGDKPRTIKSGQPIGKPRIYWMFNYDFRKLDPNRMIQVWPERQAAL
jgi:type II restriction enzyme